ncbi:MAG: hypothetical protein ABI887_13010 [Burkholderiales bacterium]
MGDGLGDGVGAAPGAGASATGVVSVEPPPPPQAAISAAMPSRVLALRQLGARRCSRKAFVSSGFMIRLLSTWAIPVIEPGEFDSPGRCVHREFGV